MTSSQVHTVIYARCTYVEGKDAGWRGQALCVSEGSLRGQAGKLLPTRDLLSETWAFHRGCHGLPREPSRRSGNRTSWNQSRLGYWLLTWINRCSSTSCSHCRLLRSFSVTFKRAFVHCREEGRAQEALGFRHAHLEAPGDGMARNNLQEELAQRHSGSSPSGRVWAPTLQASPQHPPSPIT